MATTTRARTAPKTLNPAPIAPASWLESAVLVLRASGRPMTAAEIALAAHAARCAPPSRTRTPARSVSRDVNAALRRGDTRIAAGAAPGLFCADPARNAQPAPARTPRRKPPALPVRPLAALVAAAGGLAACGIRHHPGDLIDRIRWAARLQRAYTRALTGGLISLRLADEICVHGLRQHPSEVYGNLWWDAK